MDKNKIRWKRRFIKYDEELDVTIVEIKEEDKIKEKYFLLPNIDNINYINKDIYIVQFPGGKISYSEGKIKDIKYFEITHSASTKKGSSGSPIILKNTTEVIGIHKQGNKRREENYGTSIDSIINFLNEGKLIHKSSDYYIGNMLNGLKQGKGKLYYKNGNIKYDGDFVKDKFEGNGKYYYENGEYYNGQWFNGFKQGKGKIYYKNGNIKYEGDFVNDKYEGDGKFIWKNGDYYIGQFSKGLKNGNGIIFTMNGDIKYEGGFVNNKFEGKGKYYFVNGEYYIGQWLNDLRHGKGIEYYKKGNIKYDGDFVKEKFEGNGKYYYKNGEYYNGQWLEV